MGEYIQRWCGSLWSRHSWRLGAGGRGQGEQAGYNSKRSDWKRNFESLGDEWVEYGEDWVSRVINLLACMPVMSTSLYSSIEGLGMRLT